MPRPTLRCAGTKKNSNKKTEGRFKEFAEKTGIHGVQQISRATKLWEKAFWFFMVIAAVCFLFKGMYDVLVQYAKQETLTNVGFLSPDRFPNISLCPGQFVDQGKFERLGFNYEDYVAFGGLFQDALGSFGAVTTSEEGATGFLNKVRNRFSNVDDLVRSVALDPDDFIWRAGLQSMGNDHELSPSMHLTADGMCYKLHQGSNISLSPEANLLIVMNRTNLPFSVTASQFGYTHLRIGDMADYRGVGIAIGIPKKFSYMITLRATQIRKVSKCKKYSRVQSWQCGWNIKASCCLKFDRRPFYLPEEGYTVDEISTHFFPSNSCATANQTTYKACIDPVENCKDPCESKIYEATSLFMGEPYPSKDMLFFKMPSKESSLAITEVYAVTLQNLVGNVGGLLGLWTGSSILTAIQVVVFWCSRGGTRERDTQEYQL